MSFLRGVFFISTIFLSGCGCGGDSGAAAAPVSTTSVTIYYDSGRIKESGPVLISTGERTGIWQSFHDLDGSPKQFTGRYVSNKLDATQPWQEWNADGSVRADSTDR